ncbi:hypothetical protein K439DRAFT_1623422 [Ramaria rubella]|nr:hypothetical protein K439DRAFT_1623422 [Ramaria rubella]
MKLPPVHALEKNLRGMHQYVTIMGLDNVAFHNIVRVIYSLHDLFGKHFKEGAVDEWMSSTYHNHPAVSFSSRYLSPKAHGDAVPVNKLVYPLGLFDKCDDQLVHNNSNIVNYYSCGVGSTDADEPGQFIYDHIDPAIFHLGHIVELQVAFYLHPSKTKGHWFFSPTLCSISLVDNNIDEALLKVKIDKRLYHINNVTPHHSLKRVSGIPTLEDKCTEHARKHLRKLAINEDVTDVEEDDSSSNMQVDMGSKTIRRG